MSPEREQRATKFRVRAARSIPSTLFPTAIALTLLAATAAADSSTRPFPPAAVTSETSAGKTPIRRVATSGDPAGRSSGSSPLYLALFGLIAAAGIMSLFLKRRSFGAPRTLPETVFQVLGRQTVSSSQAVLLVRLGERVLLLSQTPGGLTSLSEIEDPAEVTRLTAECLAASSKSFFAGLPLRSPPVRRHEPRPESAAHDRAAASVTSGLARSAPRILPREREESEHV